VGVVQGSVDGGEGLAKGNSPHVVIFGGILLRETGVGLIEGNEDGGFVHEGGIVEFVVQKGGQPLGGGFQVDDNTTFVAVRDVPGDMGELVLGVIALEFGGVSNVLATERVPADVVHGHERIGEAEVFALDVGLGVEFTVVARAGEVFGVHLPGDPFGIQQIDDIGYIQLMGIVVLNVVGGSSNGSDVVGLGRMTQGSVVGQHLSSASEHLHEGIFDDVVVICVSHEDDHDFVEVESIRGWAIVGGSSEGGCMPSCPDTCGPLGGGSLGCCLASGPSERISSGSLRISASRSLNHAERDEEEDHREN